MARAQGFAGRIAYRQADGGEIGRERFELVTHSGGHILRALCEMDETALLRDVTIAMAPQWRPIDGFCRIVRPGAADDTLWLDVAGDRAIGRIGGNVVAGPIAAGPPIAYLGLHPLQGDALIVQVRGTEQPGAYIGCAALTNSISPNGDEAVGTARLTIDVAYIGETAITVAAGRFAARHYRLRWREDWPPADLWVRRDDAIFLAMRWSHVPGWFELTDIDTL